MEIAVGHRIQQTAETPGGSVLAHFGGVAPPAPAWFTHAVDSPHVRERIEVEGAGIEWLGWGERGKPGLLLLHGGGANADWWRFIAPWLAEEYRVVAPSFSGMGNSDHRPRYSTPCHAREALAAADSGGLGNRFAVVGHSYGGFPAGWLAIHHAERIASTILLDSPYVDRGPEPNPDRPAHRVSPTLADALARFRWSPRQVDSLPYVTDFIARSSLKQVPGGWTWKFDSNLWPHFDNGTPRPLLGQISGPLSFVVGAKSALRPLFPAIRAAMPPGSRFVAMPEAHHHMMADDPLALVGILRALLA